MRERLEGVLLGTAVGDALGLPAEGLSRSRIERRWNGVWRHRLLFGRGLCSDDTEHTWFVAQALLAHPENPLAFQRCLARKLRLWLLGLPAGVGLATLRAALKLWLGFPPSKSGVRSAGNGPAMRSAILGVYFFDEPEKRRQFVSACTRLTHTDPRAEIAAQAVAEAAAWAVRREGSPAEFIACLMRLGEDDEWQTLCDQLRAGLHLKWPVTRFAANLGLEDGITGYAYHSVPVALYAWLRSGGNFREALVAALDCGGDTDTVGAMVGALAGASGGPQRIPAEWLDGICEWPRSLSLLRKVGQRLAEQRQAREALGPVGYFWPGLVLRNLVFASVVLGHGFLRLLR